MDPPLEYGIVEPETDDESFFETLKREMSGGPLSIRILGLVMMVVGAIFIAAGMIAISKGGKGSLKVGALLILLGAAMFFIGLFLFQDPPDLQVATRSYEERLFGSEMESEYPLAKWPTTAPAPAPPPGYSDLWICVFETRSVAQRAVRYGERAWGARIMGQADLRSTAQHLEMNAILELETWTTLLGIELARCDDLRGMYHWTMPRNYTRAVIHELESMPAESLGIPHFSTLTMRLAFKLMQGASAIHDVSLEQAILVLQDGAVCSQAVYAADSEMRGFFI